MADISKLNGILTLLFFILKEHEGVKVVVEKAKEQGDE